MMRIIWCVAALLGLVAAAPSASAWDRGDADVLTVLPNTSSGQPSSVEGLTVGPDGNIYVPTFGFNATGALTDNATLYVLKPNGKSTTGDHCKFESPRARIALQSRQRIPAGA